MSNSPRFAAIILAAGASSRMGRDKALLPWNGTTFLGATVDRLITFAHSVIVVAGANEVALRAELVSSAGAGVNLRVNSRPEEGQFSSLRIGLQEALNRGCNAALVALVDRPPAMASTIQQLIQAFRPGAGAKLSHWAVVPEFHGKHGHPIVVGAEMIDCFLKAGSAATAREVEHANQDRIRYLAVDDANVVANVNTPEEFERLRKQSIKS